jgi:DNA-binding GntR family transcriptional regulator
MRKPKASSDNVDHTTMDQDPVVQGILKAISLRRLRPGMKLGEVELASVFGTNRTHIRQVLAHLGSRNLVTHIPNRGAFVSQPSAEEARAIFDARKTLEGATISRTIDNLTAPMAQTLKRFLALERSHSHGDRWDGLNLSAGFHVEIARLSGNPILIKFMDELALRTSLIIAQFEPPGAEDHCPDAHPRIAERILARDKVGAIRAMEEHLAEMQARLRLEGPDHQVEIATIFEDLGIVPKPKTGSRKN